MASKLHRLIVITVVVAWFLSSTSEGTLRRIEQDVSDDECCYPSTGECVDREFCIELMGDQTLEKDLWKLKRLSLADFIISVFAFAVSLCSCDAFAAAVTILLDLTDACITLTIAILVKRLNVAGGVSRIIEAGCFTGAGNEVTLYQAVSEYDKLLVITIAECILEFVGVIAHCCGAAEPGVAVFGVIIDIIELILSGIAFFSIVSPALCSFEALMDSLQGQPGMTGNLVPCIYSCCST